MNTEEELDIKLQRVSADLIADLKSSLHPQLWRSTSTGTNILRSKVRQRDLSRLLHTIDSFQEIPQLLDPHLENFISLLANSFLRSLESPSIPLSTIDLTLFTPICNAICQLLYRFCKVRGEKVVVRFFSTETRHIEYLAIALEERAHKQNSIAHDSESDLIDKQNFWGWEVIYVSLLWLSQLILVPFDLVSISSDDNTSRQPNSWGLVLPSNSPRIAVRIVSLATHYLFSPSKEKDAAKHLLVRFAIRKDMQANGIMSSLVKWAILQLRPESDLSIHGSLGALSFLSDLLSSSIGTTDMYSHVFPIFQQVQEISCSLSPQAKAIKSIAVVRKILVKILRSIAVISLQNFESCSSIQLVETIIGYMLEYASDSATLVRYAASKALSIVTLKLPSDMAYELIQNIISELDENMLWIETDKLCRRNQDKMDLAKWKLEFSKDMQHDISKNTGIDSPWFEVKKIRKLDTSRVDPLKWHSIMMTLSHLIYRHAIHPAALSALLAALCLGLSFEQRSSTGTMVGSNVRDAACFGMWALARKYKTAELQNEIIKRTGEDFFLIKDQKSALQTLASDLAVSATLDPVGNIRRGSAAALQELIGRHPCIIDNGIEVVQTIDYHTISLRTRAIEVVALQTSKLSDNYHGAILDNLLGWRGIRDADKSVRQAASIAISQLVWSKHSRTGDSSPDFLAHMIDRIVLEILSLKLREADERHGLILSLAMIIKQFLDHIDKQKLKEKIEKMTFTSRKLDHPASPNILKQKLPHDIFLEEYAFFFLVRKLLQDIILVLNEVNAHQKSYRAPKLTANSVCHLIISAFGLLKVNFIFEEFKHSRGILLDSQPMFNMHAQFQTQDPEKPLTTLVELIDLHFSLPDDRPSMALKQYEAILAAYQVSSGPPCGLMNLIENLLEEFSKNADEELIDILSVAAANYGLLCGPNHEWFLKWQRNAFDMSFDGQIEQQKTCIQTMVMIPTEIYHLFDKSKESIASAIYRSWCKTDKIEMRLFIMRCIAMSSAIRESPSDFVCLIKSGLDDYTTTYQGDVGSLLRIESIRATAVIWRHGFLRNSQTTKEGSLFEELVPRIIRLASEKLDRARNEARTALLTIPTAMIPELLQIRYLLEPFSISSEAYFHCLLEIFCFLFPPNKYLWLFNDFFAGYITSADGGSEDVIRSSRAALINFCQSCKPSYNFSCHSFEKKPFVLGALVHIIRSNSKRLVVSGLEVLAFLICVGTLNEQTLLKGAEILDTVDKILCNCRDFRKIEVAIKFYGALLKLERCSEIIIIRKKAIHSLTQLLVHQYPKIRNAAADELYFWTQHGKGIDWTGEKKFNEIEIIRKSLQISEI